MNLETLHSFLSTAWVVWFFLLFVGIIGFVMRPSKRDYYRALAEIPFRDEAKPPTSRGSR